MPALKPSDIVPSINTTIPDYVIEAFNDLIRKNFDGTKAIVKMTEAELEVSKAIHMHNAEIPYLDLEAALVFAEQHHYFDIEPIFQAADWKVEFFEEQTGMFKFAAQYVFTVKH